MAENVLSGIVVLSWILLGLVFLKVVFFVTLSSRHRIRHIKSHPRRLSDAPFVSIVVPAFNESKTLANCIHSLAAQDYTRFEIIISDDGSTDDTLILANQLAMGFQPAIQVVSNPRGGKAKALNRAITRARGEIIVCMDADSIFRPDTVRQLLLSFQDPTVAAVGGNVKVANRKKLLARQQSLEYITGLTLQRKAFADLGCMQVISGAIGAFRKEALASIGGYSSETVVEDMDLTIELAKHNLKVVYNPLAIAYTEAPETLGAFLKQRYRWTYGSFQVLAKHRSSLLWQRRASRMGFIGLPYCMIFPWLEVLISAIFFITLIRAFAAVDNTFFYVVVGLMSCLQATLLTYSLISDKEDKKLVTLAVIDSFFYYHLVSLTTLRAGIGYLLKRRTGWDKLERYGKNLLPQTTRP